MESGRSETGGLVAVPTPNYGRVVSGTTIPVGPLLNPCGLIRGPANRSPEPEDVTTSTTRPLGLNNTKCPIPMFEGFVDHICGPRDKPRRRPGSHHITFGDTTGTAEHQHHQRDQYRQKLLSFHGSNFLIF